MASRPGPKRRRRTAGETRELLLAAAVDLLRERAEQAGDDVVAAALAHVRFTEVAERATARVRAEDAASPGVTTGALYNLWPSQLDFQVDLLLHVAELQSALVPGLPDSTLMFQEARRRCVPVADVVRTVAEAVCRHYRQDPLFRIELGFLIGANDPRVQQALARRNEAFSAEADQAWQALLDCYRLRLRPPYRIRDLTTAIAASLIGSVVLHVAEPGTLADPPGEPGWSLASRSAVALFEALTEHGV